MKSILEVRQLLKNYGTYIYTGDKKADLELMADEVRELYRSNVLVLVRKGISSKTA